MEVTYWDIWTMNKSPKSKTDHGFRGFNYLFVCLVL